MNDPKNRKAIRGYIIKKLNDYADKTFSKIDYSTHDSVISEYGFENREEALSGLKAKIDRWTIKQVVPNWIDYTRCNYRSIFRFSKIVSKTNIWL